MTRWRCRLLRFCVFITAWLALELPARSETERRVVLLRPSAPDQLTTMALVRIKGELAAAGFEIMTLPQRDEMAPRSAVETAAIELKPLAVFAIVHQDAKGGAPWVAEIWVSDRVVDRTSVERMRIDNTEPGRGAAVLAVRAVELLKANLAEFWTTPAARPAPPSTPAISRTPPEKPIPATPPPSHFPALSDGVAAQAAFGMLYSFGELGPVWTPVLALSYGTRRGFGARMSVAGLGSSAIVEAAEGTARIEQQLGTLEGFVILHGRGLLQLFASAGAGAYRLQLEGTGVHPYRGKNGESWSLLTGAGLGMAAEVYPHIALIAEGQSFWAWPAAVVRVADSSTGRRYWPLLLARVGIGIAF